MNRVAGLAVLALVAAACSDSPTAPGNNTKPLGANATMSAAAKAAWARSMGNAGRESVGWEGGLQYLVAPPPFWQTPYGPDLGEGDDDCREVNFGFVFTFYGRQYTRLWLNSNGNLTFDGCFTDFEPTTLPTSPRHPIIAGLFADWYRPGGGTISFRLIGQAPLRRLVVTWAGVPMFARPGTSNTHQVQLLEFLSVIVMSYNGINTNTFPPGTNWTGDPLTAGVASGGFSGITIVGTGGQIPALDGHSFCLVSFGGGAYQLYNETICRGFVF